MSIAGKHSYRFEYLKSEEWGNVRAEVLARDGAKCLICGERDISNDVRHCRYPKSFWNTKASDCITLCRFCHDKMHELMSDKITWTEIVRLTLSRVLLKLFIDLNSARKSRSQKDKKSHCRICGSREVATIPRLAVPHSGVLIPICDRCWSGVTAISEPRTWGKISKLRKNFN